MIAPSAARADGGITAPETVALGGTAVVGQTLTVDPGAWLPAEVALSYSWSKDDTVIPDETGPALALGPELLGAVVTATVTGTLTGDAGSKPEVVTRSVSTAAPVAPGVLTATPKPLVSGTVVVDEVLSVDPGDWESADLTYRWRADGGDVAGVSATAETYTVSPGDLGKRISVVVTGTRVGYTTVSTTSDETGPVAAATFFATPVPTLSGVARVGSSLTATTPLWSPSASTSAYVWLRDGWPIAGASGAVYPLVAADLNRRISVKVTGSRPGYNDADRSSVATGPVAAGTLVASGVPSIIGTPRVATGLTANPGTWTPAASFTYQWLANRVAIPGATSPTYVPTAAERGKRISVAIVAQRAGYAAAGSTSAETAAVDFGRFVNAPTPSISGTPRVGVTLTANTGPWSPSATFSFQWKANGASIAGATARSYLLKPADRTKVVTVVVTGARSGFATVSKTSARTSAIGYGVFTTAPLPKVSGAARVGYTLTATPGTWSPSATLTYRWKRSGVPISGATGRTYRLTASDHGKVMTVTVTAARSGWVTTARTSAGSARVVKLFSSTYSPTLTGTARVYSTLKASTRAWSPTATFQYQWMRNGVAIGGARASGYTLSPADYGKRITVRIRGSRTLYVTTDRTSAATATIAGPAATLSRDGMYRVGTNIAAGTYVSPGSVNGCYWERRSNNGIDLGGVYANSFTDGGQVIVTISSSDRYFFTDGCGSWTRLWNNPSLRTSVGDGMYKAGAHIKPGDYEARVGYGCYVAVLSGFGGTIGDIVDNEFTDGPTVLTATVSNGQGLETSGCGTWRWIGSPGSSSVAAKGSARTTGVPSERVEGRVTVPTIAEVRRTAGR